MESLNPSLILKVSFCLFVLSAIALPIAWWKTFSHPNSVATEELQREPLQTPVQRPPFDIERKGVKYRIVPLYDYDIFGLIVATHDSTSFFDISHKDWNDYANTGDICIVWGSNLSNGHLGQMAFSHGDWTCYAQTSNREAWSSFDMTKLSNNHVLPASPEIEAALRGMAVGDEIHIKGSLVNYGILGRSSRNTSTTRTDTGNGACEIIYVTEANRLKRHNGVALFAGKAFECLALTAILGCLLALALPFFSQIQD